MLILGIETSAALCSVAWVQDDQVLSEENVEMPNMHTTLLPEMLRKGFLDLNLGPDKIDLIAVSSGPGSFTGIRIGMAYAKGMGYALDVPVIAVSNFEVLANQAVHDRFPIWTVIDARRGNYYVGVFDNQKYALNQSKFLAEAELLNLFDRQGIIITPIEKFCDTCDLKTEVLIGRYSSAITAKLGKRKFDRDETDDIDRLEPLYIREFSGTT